MRISTKFGGMMLVIILLTGFLMFFTLTSINEIKNITTEHQERNTPLMVTALSFKRRDSDSTVAYGYLGNPWRARLRRWL